MPLQAVEPQRLYRQIADQLRTLIQSGEFVAGSRLPAERDLSKQLGVSRPSVREALIALEVEGWVEVRTGSGVYVLDRAQHAPSADKAIATTEWGPLELIRARRVVEGEIAAIAALQAKRRHLDAMRQAGAEGVAQPIAALVKRLEADAHDRARSADQARTDRDQLHAAASHMAMASQGMTLDRCKEWLAAALISIAVIFAAAWIWRWAEEPKIETHVYGCSTGWDAKKAVCRGKWVPLVKNQGGE